MAFSEIMLHFRRFVLKGSSPHANLFPDKLFHKKQKVPAQLYVAETHLADEINKSIEPFLQQTKCDTAIEMNPGIGLFTRKLLNRDERLRKIVLVEVMDHFLPTLGELHAMYPERVKVKHNDIVGLWRLAYQDRMDHGTRVAELLSDLPKHEYTDEPTALLFGAVGCYNFFKHLINSIIFQNGIFSHGRFEMYLVVPPPIFIHLTCSNDIGYMIYRSTSMLFQMLFEYRFITRLPREHFLPNQGQRKVVKGARLTKVTSINPEYLYLVRIVPRRDFYDLCPIADLQSLWYFVKQNCVSRRNRIIPNLEKWIPGCGPRLIINNKPSVTLKPLYDDEDVALLPQYSSRCTTMSNRDFYPHLNIYTQFGDLSPSQMLTLFTQFRQWHEYGQSSFLASLENTLLKMEAAVEENIDIVEEDDLSSEEVVLEGDKETAPNSDKETKQRKRNAVTST
uniref:rRNA adenine N(6)-methyltransferase n=1 Tax=Ceratitis capitata TaxID=7213 RepID=W8AS10_CERCA